MAPSKLIVKNSNGKLQPFEVDGVEWIDGSVQVRAKLQSCLISSIKSCMTGRPAVSKDFNIVCRHQFYCLANKLSCRAVFEQGTPSKSQESLLATLPNDGMGHSEPRVKVKPAWIVSKSLWSRHFQSIQAKIPRESDNCPTLHDNANIWTPGSFESYSQGHGRVPETWSGGNVAVFEYDS